MRGKKASLLERYRLPLSIIVGVIVVVVGTEFYLSGCCAAPVSNQSQVAVGEPMTLAQKEAVYPKAPELAGISGYINTGGDISLASLKDEGKIVLVDFWTYSCINCQRTTPYLNAWYEKYRDMGLEIIGVHSPEFEFEKDYGNVKDAVQRFGIKYPVVQDNDFDTWRSYGNRYWPRKYLVDIDGFVAYDHIGEGAYEETEKRIQELLAERAARLDMKTEIDTGTVKPQGAVAVDSAKIATPEIYLGYRFARAPLGNQENFVIEKSHTYTLPENTTWKDNLAYLGGTWYSFAEYVEHKGEQGRVALRYTAGKVNIVAEGQGTVSVWIDGKPAGPDGGIDVKGDEVTIDGSRLYNVVSSQSYGTHNLELVVRGDLNIYTFTFG